MSDRISYAEAVIANGASLSGEVDLRDHNLVGLEIQGTWTAAGISFQSVSRNDGAAGTSLTETFLTVVDQAGSEITITAVASARFILFTSAVQDQLRGLARTKLRSGTNALPVAQAQAVTVRCILQQRY